MSGNTAKKPTGKSHSVIVSIIKLIPIILMAVMVTIGVDILLSASIGFFLAAIECSIFEKQSLTKTIGIGVEGAKDGMQVGMILMMAYAVAQIFMYTGVGAAAITIFLKLGITGRGVALISFLTTCALSVATGTSWGTYAACAPIFLWLGAVVGGNPGMIMAACMGGSAFGDNIGLISDTTILSSGLQGVKPTDRVRVQWPWSIICVLLSALLFYFVSMAMGLPSTTGDVETVLNNMSPETISVIEAERPAVLTLLDQVREGVPIWMIIPIIAVIIMAIRRIDTMICLASGIVLSVILGFFAGTLSSITEVLEQVKNGFADAGSWAVIMLFWAMGFGGIMRKMDAYRPLINFFVRVSRKVRHLVTCNGILCLFMNATINEEMSMMACVGQVTKDIVEENVEGSEEDIYKLKLRNALFADAVGVHSATLIPWHTGVAYYMGMAAAVYPIYAFSVGDLYFNFMSIICVVSIYLLTFTGLDRFIPLFGLPREPKVRLKKNGKTGEAGGEATTETGN